MRYLTDDSTRRLLVYSQLSKIGATVLGAMSEVALLRLYHIALKHALNAHTAYLIPNRVRSDTLALPHSSRTLSIIDSLGHVLFSLVNQVLISFTLWTDS